MGSELDRLWSKDKTKQSQQDPVFATALRYLYNQWDGLMNYRNDGEYSIDNNIAERNVRPATIERKNSLSFASEDGIVSYEGYRDFAKMIPGELAIN